MTISNKETLSIVRNLSQQCSTMSLLVLAVRQNTLFQPFSKRRPTVAVKRLSPPWTLPGCPCIDPTPSSAMSSPIEQLRSRNQRQNGLVRISPMLCVRLHHQSQTLQYALSSSHRLGTIQCKHARVFAFRTFCPSVEKVYGVMYSQTRTGTIIRLPNSSCRSPALFPV